MKREARNMMTAAENNEENSIFSRRGFTLIELMVVVALAVVIFSFAFGVGYRFYSSHVLISERDNAVNLLRNARNLAMDNYDQSDYGLYLAPGQYVLFEGASYASRNSDYDESFPVSSLVSLSGLSEIVFGSPDGGSNVSGTIALSTSEGNSNVYVNSEGRIDW